MALSKRRRIFIEAGILLGLVLTFASIIIVQRIVTTNEALLASIYHHETLLKQYDLSLLDEQGEYYTVDLGDTGSLKVHAKKHAIAVVSSSCPGHDCIHQGYISHTYQVIVCAPLGVYISLSGSVTNDVEVG